MKQHLGGLTILLLLCLFLKATTARMSVAEEHEFIKDYLTEMKGFDLDKESLIVYNFGYNRPLPFPAIALTPNTNMTFNLQTSGMHAQSRRSIAVVGKKYVGRFVEIMLVVDRLHEESQGLPSDIFLQSKHGIKLENMSSHHMHEEPSLLSYTHTEAIENITTNANIDNSIQVYIPLQKSSQSFVTKIKCQVNSKTTHDVLISKELHWQSYKEICNGEPRKVNLGYVMYSGMKVENNSLVIHWPPLFPRAGIFLYGVQSSMSFDWEVLSKFFSIHNIEPNWLDCNTTYGWYDDELREWTGCMGKIERDETDIVAPGDYGCYHGRSTIAICAPGYIYLPLYWFSRYPAKVAPTWNLLKLFDRTSWILIFISIILVTLFFFLAARIGTKYFGIPTIMEEIILSPFRVPLIANQARRFNFGFASNMVLLLWCVCGGLLAHMLEANFLTILLKPVYEKPIDTAQDVLDRGLTLISSPYDDSIVEKMKKSPFYITRTLAERTIVPKDWSESDGWVKDKVLDKGSAVVEAGLMYDYELDWAKDYNTRWYRSKDKKGGEDPFGSYMMNKKWTLQEEFNNHMLRFQQVTAGLVVIEVGFKQEPDDDKPEPLEMEHFYFPLGLWSTGLVISVICLLAEIIVNYIRKQSNKQGTNSTSR